MRPHDRRYPAHHSQFPLPNSDGKLSFEEFTNQVASTDIARQLTLDVSSDRACYDIVRCVAATADEHEVPSHPGSSAGGILILYSSTRLGPTATADGRHPLFSSSSGRVQLAWCFHGTGS